MGSVASPPPTLPNIESLRALFPPSPRRPESEYSVAYVYAGVALVALGEEKRIPDLWRRIAQAHAGGEAAQAVAAKRLREGLVKASPLVGFPRAINALTALRQSIKQTCPPSVSSDLPSSSSPASSSPDPQAAAAAQRRLARGQALFDATYGPHAARVRGDLDAISGGVLGGFAVGCVYGGLLAVGVGDGEEAEDEEEGDGEDGRREKNGGGESQKQQQQWRLSAKESAGLVFVACLAAGQGAQAKGHMYGARNLGNSGAEIRATVELVVRLAESLTVGLSLEEMGFLEKLKDW